MSTKELLKVDTKHGEVIIRQYDIIQKEVDGEWRDFSTIKETTDAQYAVYCVNGTHWEFKGKFRVIAFSNGGVILLQGTSF